ncbi:MAG: transcriptional regulator containing an amidase domain and an AraC-type DNA-binding domain [Marmoricola sp.]|nr:transcriptional regulator containing an amidase domain and an AraC-type DNA-binding domain [Marmoricola sp.]
MSLTALRLGQLTVGRLGYGQDVRLMTDEATNFHLDVPIAEHAEMSAGRAELVATQREEAAVFSPGEPARMRWSDNCLQVCLMIPRASLDTQLEELIGRSVVRPLRFDFSMDLRGPIGRSWIDTVRLLARELDEGPGLLLHQYAGPHVQSLLLDGLLLGQPHSYSEEIGGRTRPGAAATIARDVDLINERADEPWSSTSLAREVHLSVRALQEGFSETLANRPMRYLRDVRLRRVHGVLREARPGSVTVEAVASRWGVLHMSRWPAAYRVAFGEPPSSTLAR